MRPTCMPVLLRVALVLSLAACGDTTFATGDPTPRPEVSPISMGDGPEEVPVPDELRQLSSREAPLGSTATKVASFATARGDLVIAMTLAGSFECRLTWLEEPSGRIKAQGNGCGAVDPQHRWPSPQRLEVNATGSGPEGRGVFTGTLPRGAELVRIEANGQSPVHVRPFDAGEAWQHRRFFVVTVPLVRPTTLRALDADGKVMDSYVEEFV